MRVLVACEFSGVVRDAFTRAGHDAWSCDLLPSESYGINHIRGNVLDVLDGGWDLMIAHPPCTYLCNSGISWLYRRPERWLQLERARDFFMELWHADIPRICVENPVPHRHGRLPKYTQTIQPYQFGEDASKRTCLWLQGLPKLRPTKIVKPSRPIASYHSSPPTKMVYANQTKSGRNNVPPGPTRWMDRSRTYKGIAEAMAEQWGGAKTLFS